MEPAAASPAAICLGSAARRAAHGPRRLHPPAALAACGCGLGIKSGASPTATCGLALNWARVDSPALAQTAPVVACPVPGAPGRLAESQWTVCLHRDCRGAERALAAAPALDQTPSELVRRCPTVQTPVWLQARAAAPDYAARCGAR